jgi:hypothetical protein
MKRSGVTFTEVMFAVVILGIGFIMIAGTFPVTLSQVKLTVDEAAAAGIAQSAQAYLQSIATRELPIRFPNDNEAVDLKSAAPASASMFPPTNPLNSTPPPIYLTGQPAQVAPINLQLPILWESVKGQMIYPQDPRYAWVALYQRNAGASQARIFLFVVQNRTNNPYRAADLMRWQSGSVADLPASQPCVLEPRPVYFSVTKDDPRSGAVGIDIIRFFPPPGAILDHRQAVAEGCFVIVADDGGPIAGKTYISANGRYYRIGNRRTDLDVSGAFEAWELAPGHGAGPSVNVSQELAKQTVTVSSSVWAPGATDGTTAYGAAGYIIGRQSTTPTSPPTPPTYLGPAQDIALYSFTIKAR